MKKQKPIKIPKAIMDKDIYNDAHNLTQVPPALTAAMKKQKDEKAGKPAEPEYVIRQLSEFNIEAYAFCGKCANVWENDVHTQHPVRPKCKIVMENISKEGGLNKRKQQLRTMKQEVVTA